MTLQRRTAAHSSSIDSPLTNAPVQRAQSRPVHKPWGSKGLGQWSRLDGGELPVGEVWFDLPTPGPDQPSLLLKLLFTEQRLSVQVHPDDAFAHSIGLANGKSEAWHVLSSRPGSQVATGLTTELTADELRTSILDGSIADLVAWRQVSVGETIFVPAGTIHAIGPGLVIAEIQQRSDTTFRMFDFGRGRSLDVESAIAVAHAGPFQSGATPQKSDESRTMLVDSAMLVVERIDLPAAGHTRLTAEGETWVMVIEGALTMGTLKLVLGEVAYMSEGSTNLDSDSGACVALVAYPGPARKALLDVHQPMEVSA